MVFNSGANKGFWQYQLTDAKTRRYIPMGGAVTFKIQLPGVKGLSTGHGIFVGRNKPGYVKIQVKDPGTAVPIGIYEVEDSEIQAAKAIIPTDKLPDNVKINAAQGPTPDNSNIKKIIDRVKRVSSSGIAKDLVDGDVVERDDTKDLGIVSEVSHTADGNSAFKVDWVDGTSHTMDVPSDKKLKIWKEKTENPVSGVKKEDSSSTSTPLTGLKKSMTGAEVQAKKVASVSKILSEEGRFPIPRQTSPGRWGIDSDIAKGARADYSKVYDALKKSDPAWEEKYKTFEDFWKKVESFSVEGTSKSPNSLDDIPQEMKDINRAYAETILGLDPDGIITFYRNAVNNASTPENAARGYVTTNADFAYDYSAERDNIGTNGRYEIDAKPEEVFGMLGYSRLEDEYGVVVGDGVTQQQGRIRRVGDLKVPEFPSWLEEANSRVPRSQGATPFRHHAVAGLFDFYPVDESITTPSAAMEKYGFTSEDIAKKFDEKFGNGAYQKYKDSGAENQITSQDLRNVFIPLDNGQVGFNPVALSPNATSLDASSYGQTDKPETFTNDKFDNLMKMLDTLQDLTGEHFMVPKNRADTLVEKDITPVEKKTGIFNEYDSKQRTDATTSNAAEDTPLSELGFDPEEEITIYRGVPKGIKDINPGDWVTANPQLAKDYAGTGDVISIKVKAKDLLTDPSSGEGGYTEEMVYRPTEKEKNSVEPTKPEPPSRVENTPTTNLNSLVSTQDIPKEDEYLIATYTGEGSSNINGYLRNLDRPLYAQFSGQANALVDIINNNKLLEDTTLYRIVQDPPGSFNVGDIVSDSGISSTTKISDLFQYKSVFTDIEPDNFERFTLFTIKAPKNTPALDVSNISMIPNEKEVILPPNTEMRVISSTDVSLESSKIYPYYIEKHVVVEVVPKTNKDVQVNMAKGPVETPETEPELPIVGTRAINSYGHKMDPTTERKGSGALLEILDNAIESAREFGWDTGHEVDEEGNVLSDPQGDAAQSLEDIGEKYMKWFVQGWPSGFDYVSDFNADFKELLESEDNKINPNDLTKLSSRTREIISALELLQASPNVPESLYRGIRTNQATLDSYAPGATIDLPFSSFSLFRTSAKQYWELPRSDIKGGGFAVEYELESGSQSIPLNAFDPQAIEGEFVSAGRYEVISVERSDDPNVPTKVKIKHVGTFSPTLQKEDKTPIIINPGAITTDQRNEQLAEAEADALERYTDDGYWKINEHLRTGAPLSDEDKGYLDKLLELIRGTKVTNKSVVYRGRAIKSQKSLDEINALTVGDIITDPGIISTTTDLKRADFYLNMKLDDVKDRVLFKINIPEGFNAFEVSDEYSSYDGESEVLLPPGTAMKLVATGEDNGTKVLEFELVNI